MSLTVTIAGTDRTSKVMSQPLELGPAISYSRVAGSPAQLSFRTYDTDGATGYRPAIDDSVLIQDGSTSVGGVVSDLDEDVLSDPDSGVDKGVICGCTCQDQNGLLLREPYTASYPDNTSLKAILTDLVANGLSGTGVTLDPSQATGPLLDAVSFSDMYPLDIIGQLRTMTGWIDDVTGTKVLSMIAPGSVSCGFSLTDANGDTEGPIKKRQSANQQYANRIEFTYGPSSQVTKLWSVTGDGVTDRWTLEYPGAQTPDGHLVARPLVADSAFGGEVPIGVVTVDPVPSFYEYDPSTNEIIRRAGALPAGATASLSYSAQFPVTLVVEDAAEIAARGYTRTRKITAENVTDKSTAGQLAAGYLSQGTAMPVTVTLSHRKGFARVGQSISLSFAERAISGTFMVTETSFVTAPDGALLYTITAVEGSTLQANWLDYFKTSGGTSAPSGTFTGSLAASGRFGDDVVANVGAASSQVMLRQWTGNTRSGTGPAVFLGRGKDLEAGTWVMLATMSGILGGQTERLSWLLEEDLVNDYVMQLRRTANGQYCLMPCTQGGTLGTYLGDPLALTAEISSVRTWAGIRTNILQALDGIFERGLSVRLGDWQTYTCTWGAATTNPTLGNGTLSAWYARWGKTVKVHIRLLVGSTTTFGSGLWTFSLPSSRYALTGFADEVGHGMAFLNAVSKYYHFATIPFSASTVSLVGYGDATGVTSTNPAAWQNGDLVRIDACYQEA